MHALRKRAINERKLVKPNSSILNKFNNAGRMKKNKQYNQLEGCVLRNKTKLLKSSTISYNNCTNASSNINNKKVCSVMKNINKGKESKPENVQYCRQ